MPESKQKRKMPRKKFNVFRNGRVHVCAKMCKSCIFKADSWTPPETVARMVRDAIAKDNSIVCHSTLGTKEHAVCRGFFENHLTSPLRLAAALGMIEFSVEKK